MFSTYKCHIQLQDEATSLDVLKTVLGKLTGAFSGTVPPSLKPQELEDGQEQTEGPPDFLILMAWVEGGL